MAPPRPPLLFGLLWLARASTPPGCEPDARWRDPALAGPIGLDVAADLGLDARQWAAMLNASNANPRADETGLRRAALALSERDVVIDVLGASVTSGFCCASTDGCGWCPKMQQPAFWLASRIVRVLPEYGLRNCKLLPSEEVYTGARSGM